MDFSRRKMILISLGIFFIGFVVFFPIQNFKGLLFKSILENTGIVIVAEEIKPLFLGWPGIRFKKVNVSIPAGTDSFELSSELLDSRVRLSSLYIPSASLFFDDLKGGGSLFLKIGALGNTAVLKVQSQNLELSEIAIPGLEQRLQGKIQTDISLKYQESNFSESHGTVLIEGKNFRIPSFMINNPMLGPPFQSPELEVGPINIDVRLKDGNAQINSFQFGSDKSDLKASFNGSARLGNNPIDTQLNLTLKINFSDKIVKSPEYKILLDFLRIYQGSKEGEYGMSWNARIQEILNLSKALPNPVK